MLPSIFSENLFDDFFDDFALVPMRNKQHNPLYGKHAKNLMRTDIREIDTTYEIDVDLPGFKKEDVHIDLKDGYLTISAEKSLDKEDKQEGRYIRQERYSGSCARSFYVGEVRPEDIHAKYEDGVLSLSFPKEEEKKLPAQTRIAIE